MELKSAVEFARSHRKGVLGTIRKDGRPQLSNIIFVAQGDEFAISVTTDRAKTRNLRRDPRAVLYVPGDDFWNFVVLDGTVTLTDVTTEPGDDVCEQLVEYYRQGAGEHPDWDDYRATVVREGRLIARFLPTSAAGMLQKG
jgi:PPOX class probable F420-dependent enzyme